MEQWHDPLPARSGKHPFDSAGDYEVARKITQGELVTPLDAWRADLPPDLSSLVRRALHPNRAERPQTASEFRQALLACQDPVWLTGGANQLKAFLAELYPRAEDRSEAEIEKTPVLSSRGTPLPGQFNPEESFISGAERVTFPTTLKTSSPPRPRNPARTLWWLLLLVPLAAWGWMKFKPGTPPAMPTAASTVPSANPNSLLSPTVPVPTEVPTAAAPPRIEQGRLSIEGPAGAGLFVGGKRFGALPVKDLRIPAGIYLVQIKPPGGRVLSRRVKVSAARTTVVHLGGPP